MNNRPTLSAIFIILVLCAFFEPYSAAAAPIDTVPWSFFRNIVIPSESPSLIVIELDSALIEKSRPDFADLRIVSNSGQTVGYTLINPPAAHNTSEETAPKAMRVSRAVGKWTDIWIDKGSKSLSTGFTLETSSTDFARRLEIKGSDNTKDYYVLSMDKMLVDAPGPIPVRSLTVDHQANNFQYLHIRVIDDELSPLQIEGISLKGAKEEYPLLRRADLKVVEKKSDPTTGAAYIIADLGPNSYPLARIALLSPEREFAKHITIFSAKAPDEDTWRQKYSSIYYRLRKEEAKQENITFNFQPITSRYIKIELTGGARQILSITGVETWSIAPAIAFEAKEGETYRLYYGASKATPETQLGPSINVSRIFTDAGRANMSDEITVVRSRKTPASPAVSKPPGVATTTEKLGKIVGIAMLLVGLLLLFSIMLRARSLRKERKRTQLRPMDRSL